MEGYYETYCRYCGARLDPDSGLCAEYECFRCGRRPDQLVLTRRVGGELKFLEVDCTPLEPAVVCTSADVYGPADPVEILVAAPGAWRREAKVEIRSHGALLDSIQVDLSPQGNALVSLPPLVPGKYVVHLAIHQPGGRTLTQDHHFQVSCRDLSVLRAVVLESARQNEMLVFRLLVTWMAGEPYEGPIELVILDDQEKVEIFRMALDVRRGRVSGAFRTPEWVGPFSARLTAANGQSTWIRFLDEDPGLADEILGLSFGPRRRLSLSSWEGREECHGVRFLSESETEAPLVPVEMIGRRGELLARRDIPRLHLQVRHPGSGGRVENAVYTGIREGERIPFSATPPYCFFLVAADFNEKGGEFDPGLVFEGWGVFFVWNEGRAVVRSPRRVEPGSRLRIEVDGTRGIEGFLVVRQVGLPSMSITGKLASALYENVRSNCLLEGPETYEPDDEEEFLFDEDSDPSAPLPDHLRLVPGLDRLIDDLAAGCNESSAERPAVRQEDLRVLLLRRIMLDGPVEFAVRAPERIGDVETIFFQCGPHGWRVDRAVTEVGGDEYVYGSTPDFLFPEDSVEVELHYRTEHSARLVAVDGRGTVLVGKEVAGEGSVPVPLSAPGFLEWSLQGASAPRAVRRKVGEGGRRAIVRTTFRYLAPGEELERDRLVAYPDPRLFRDDLADAASRVAHSGIEQLSARLRCLAFLWPTGTSQRTTLAFRIRTLGRVLLEAAPDPGELWSLWPGDPPVQRVSAQVAKNLAPFLGIAEFPELAALARRSVEALAASGYRDDELLEVDPHFIEETADSAEALAAEVLIGSGDARRSAIERLLAAARRDESGRLHWSGRSWAGSVETTAKVARALFRAAHPAFGEALLYLGDRLIDGRLHGTTDTIALLDLLTEMASRGNRGVLEVDGQRALPDEVTVGRRIRCLEGRVLVRHDEESVVELRDAPPRPDARIQVLSPEHGLRVGRRLRLSVEFAAAEPESVCRIFLPPTLAPCQTESSEHEVVVPLRAAHFTLECLCVRRGVGGVRALVEDLYRVERRSWIEGPAVRVV